MMFPIGRKRCGRRNPQVATLLGLASATMFLVAALLHREHGAHWPIAVAGVVCVGLVAVALFRLAALNRDGRGG
ncbi:hypothetical protein RZN05_13515 [Sphingomonas sp. HF-S4]|uniref:Uncharacterized protein n=1 Tax=Sphingomonas agrestis TaxID=3080540 RepID=A0ABU3Y9C7_9SPHN|nr:hypothetical protein [Sphingomonas sp. HF-S4]MDV3458008.1 hypothetical protein [Sphingomonas sp. HF-S4]